MALVKLPGQGAWWNNLWYMGSAPSAANIGPIDATGEKLAFCGRFWHPEHTSKDISRVCFRFGTVVKAGGSGLTVSLQDVSLTTGPPMQPDETQDQTVAIANGNASFASNTWIRTGALSANRTVTPGDLLAMVVEYDGGGRLGADSVNLSIWESTGISIIHTAWNVLKTASFASVGGGPPNVIFECSDGSFGTLEGALPFKAINNVNIESDTTPDEVALKYTTNAPIGVDAMIWAHSASTEGGFDAVLYNSGGTALKTTTIDGDTAQTVASVRPGSVPFSAEELLSAGADYYFAIKPNSTTLTVTVTNIEVDDANHWKTHPMGTAGIWTQRTDGGAWSDTPTKKPLIGFRLSSVSDGAGGGGHRHLLSGGVI